MLYIENRKRCVAAVLAVVGLYVIYAKSSDTPREPPINLHPKHHLHLSGHIDSALAIDSITLALHSTVDACVVTVNWLKGVTSDNIFRYRVPFDTTANGYDAWIYLDQFEPGECKWVPLRVEVVVRKGDIRSFSRALWIYHPDKAKRSGFPREGPKSAATFDMMCRVFEYKPTGGKPFLDCDPQVNSGYLMSMSTTEAVINIFEGNPLEDPKYNARLSQRPPDSQ
jgi:hypothetical protein